MKMGESYKILADWDDEAKVWVATSDDVPGLVTGAETLDALIEKLKVMVPEMLEANGVFPCKEATFIPFDLLAQIHEKADCHC